MQDAPAASEWDISDIDESQDFDKDAEHYDLVSAIGLSLDAVEGEQAEAADVEVDDAALRCFVCHAMPAEDRICLARKSCHASGWGSVAEFRCDNVSMCRFR